MNKRQIGLALSIAFIIDILYVGCIFTSTLIADVKLFDYVSMPFFLICCGVVGLLSYFLSKSIVKKFNL